MIVGHVKIFYLCGEYIKYFSFGPSILYNFEVSTFGFLGHQLFEQMKVSKRNFEQFISHVIMNSSNIAPSFVGTGPKADFRTV